MERVTTARLSVSDSFIRPFRERHLNLVERKAYHLEVDRMIEASPTATNIYFNALEKYFQPHHYDKGQNCAIQPSDGLEQSTSPQQSWEEIDRTHNKASGASRNWTGSLPRNFCLLVDAHVAVSIYAGKVEDGGAWCLVLAERSKAIYSS